MESAKGLRRKDLIHHTFIEISVNSIVFLVYWLPSLLMVEEVSLVYADSLVGYRSSSKLYQKPMLSRGILVNNWPPCSDFTSVQTSYRHYK